MSERRKLAPTKCVICGGPKPVEGELTCGVLCEKQRIRQLITQAEERASKRFEKQITHKLIGASKRKGRLFDIANRLREKAGLPALKRSKHPTYEAEQQRIAAQRAEIERRIAALRRIQTLNGVLRAEEIKNTLHARSLQHAAEVVTPFGIKFEWVDYAPRKVSSLGDYRGNIASMYKMRKRTKQN